jgi:hypothetical protein
MQDQALFAKVLSNAQAYTGLRCFLNPGKDPADKPTTSLARLAGKREWSFGQASRFLRSG